MTPICEGDCRLGSWWRRSPWASNHSTVWRRLDRSSNQIAPVRPKQVGYTLTPVARTCRLADHIADDITTFERRNLWTGSRRSGELRITTNDMCSFHLLTDVLAGFRRAVSRNHSRHHSVEHVAQSVETRRRRGHSRTYQIALLIGRCVSPIAWAVFAPKQLRRKRASPFG